MKYLIVEEGWEYNDEYFHQGQEAGYNIRSKLYTSKEEAQKKVDALNKKVMSTDFVDSEDEPIIPYKVVEVEEEEFTTGDPIEDAQKLVAFYEEQIKAIQAKLKKELPKILKTLFKKHPKIETIGWTQFTPYFNDGDTCYFSVNNDDLTVNGDRDWDMWYAEEFLRSGKYKDKIEGVDLEIIKGVMDFKKVLQGIPSEFYKAMYGDHAEITIDKTGKATIQDCEHD